MLCLGSSPLASQTSRKRLREPEGPFAISGPPPFAPKTSEEVSSPGLMPALSLDSVSRNHPGAATTEPSLSAPSGVRQPHDTQQAGRDPCQFLLHSI